MSDKIVSAIKQLVYPVSDVEQTTAKAYYDALARAASGYYPVGKYRLWHGGIHLDRAVLSQLGQKGNTIPIMAMAAGEVVAYRIDGQYKTLTIEDNTYLFSTGFVLVRHRLVLPSLPKEPKKEEEKKASVSSEGTTEGKEASPAQAVIENTLVSQNKDSVQSQHIVATTTETTTPTKNETGTTEENNNAEQDASELLTIYSLYMHGMHYAMYEKESTLNRPTYWESVPQTNTYWVKADNAARLRDAPNGKRIFTFIKEAELQLTEERKTTTSSKGNIFTWGALSKVITPLEQSAVEYKSLSESVKASPEGWVCVDDLTIKTMLHPHEKDSIVILDPPVAINAGDFLGYVGHYQFKCSELSVSPLVHEPVFDPLLHLECFTADDLPAFIKKSRSRAEKLAASHRTLLAVDKGTQLYHYQTEDIMLYQGMTLEVLQTVDDISEVRVKYCLTVEDEKKDLGNYDKSKKTYSINEAQRKALLVQINAVLSETSQLSLVDIPTEVKLEKEAVSESKQREISFYKKNDTCRYWVKNNMLLTGPLLQSIKGWSYFPLDAKSKVKEDENSLITVLSQTFPIKMLPTQKVITKKTSAEVQEKKEKQQDKKKEKQAENTEIEWYKIYNINAKGEPIEGWVNSTQITVKKVSPWNWHGFETLIEGHDNTQLSQRLNRVEAYQLNESDYTPTMKALHTIIQQVNGGAQDIQKPLTSTELKKALSIPSLSHQLSRLLIHYESEWYCDDTLAKWQALDVLFGYEELEQCYLEMSADKLKTETLITLLQVSLERAKKIKCGYIDYFAQMKEAQSRQYPNGQSDMLKIYGRDLKHIQYCKASWQAEKEQRIKPLLWWTPELASKLNLPKEAKVWHLHPVALIEDFDNSGGFLTEPLLIALGVNKANAKKYVDVLNEQLIKYDIKSELRVGHFISQVLTESTYLRDTKEIGRNLPYDPWRGRGLMQVTLEKNYEAYGKFVNEDVTTGINYTKLELLPHNVISAIWFWEKRANLTPYADKDDFMWITRIINGGFNGYDHRREILNKFIKESNNMYYFTKNTSGVYKFEDSKAYNEMRASFAWGLWNDPSLTKKGITIKTKTEALKGYKRFVTLHDAAGKPAQSANDKWYGYANARKQADDRIKELENDNKI